MSADNISVVQLYEGSQVIVEKKTSRGAVFIFLFLIHGFFLALKLAGVRGQKKTPHTEHERGH